MTAAGGEKRAEKPDRKPKKKCHWERMLLTRAIAREKGKLIHGEFLPELRQDAAAPVLFFSLADKGKGARIQKFAKV